MNNNDPNIGWLKCRLDKGMFSDEIAATYPPESNIDNCKFSVFVPTAEVQGVPGALGKVRIRVVKNNSKLIAVLPTSYGDLVEVAAEDVSSDCTVFE